MLQSSLIPPHLLSTQQLQNWQRMELMPTLLQTTQGAFSSFLYFLAFSLLLMVFVFLTFSLNLFNSSASFRISSFSSYSLTNDISSSYSNNFDHSDRISLDSTSSSMINNKCIDTKTWQSCLDQKIITQRTIANSTSSIPLDQLHNHNQSLFYT